MCSFVPIWIGDVDRRVHSNPFEIRVSPRQIGYPSPSPWLVIRYPLKKKVYLFLCFPQVILGHIRRIQPSRCPSGVECVAHPAFDGQISVLWIANHLGIWYWVADQEWICELGQAGSSTDLHNVLCKKNVRRVLRRGRLVSAFFLLLFM